MKIATTNQKPWSKHIKSFSKYASKYFNNKFEIFLDL